MYIICILTWGQFSLASYATAVGQPITSLRPVPSVQAGKTARGSVLAVAEAETSVEGEGVWLPLGLGVGEGVGERLPEADAEGVWVRVGRGVGLTVWVREIEAEGVRDAEAVGDVLGDQLGSGVWACP